MGLVRTCCLAVLVFTSTARAQQPSLGAAQSDFAAGNYRDALQKISRVLSGPTARGGSQERYDLLMLRGECMLNLKNSSLASESFDSASRVTLASESPKRSAAAKAMVVLIENAPQLQYKPVNKPDAAAIDIVKPDGRKQAMTALFDELYPKAQAKVDAATSASDIKTMRDALPPVADLYVLELTTTGDTKRSAPLFVAIGTHARRYIAEELDKTGKRTDELAELALEPKEAAATPDAKAERRGLTAEERKEFSQITKQLDELRLAAQDGRRISRRLGTTGEQWDPLVAECAEVRERAHRVTAAH